MTHLQPSLRHVSCLDSKGLHRMAYWEWGDPESPRVVMCVHGLSRQGRDFDVLARALVAEGFRVICPDVVGRGHSDGLRDPAGYVVPTYVADMVTLIARLDVQELAWVGTSMGGLIGMALASLPGSLISKLVLNDIGPVIEAVALQRISAYLGDPTHWPSIEAAAEALWEVSKTFGPHTPAQWLELCRHQLKPVEGGGYQLHYDPAIAFPLRHMTLEAAQLGTAALWYAYDQISCPTLLVHGVASDLLSPATVMAMGQRGPRARVVEIEGVGHAPTLVHSDQVEAVLAFLRDTVTA
ncbi:MAG: alpha/beta fold hydrolase [Leptothrix ochracea]|uniref:alpha/beta fold hydrolase n=1 Tax=Leptothrix ochracea TaxID=735331 RepID=UPI0034E2060D